MEKPRALLTNDDGIDSLFLRALADALVDTFTLYIAAPATEQSWIGRAMTRRTPVTVESIDTLPAKAWAIGGTPSDCVNIALANLLGELPDIVISGINIGHNASLPLLYSSGTIAGALEGANWGLPALAVSQQITEGLFEDITAQRGQLPEPLQPYLKEAARQTAALAKRMIGHPNKALHVYNLNFPMPLGEKTPWVATRPAYVRLPGLYEAVSPGTFRFRFAPGKPIPTGTPTDRETLLAGRVSLSILNFGALSTSNEEELPGLLPPEDS